MIFNIDRFHKKQEHDFGLDGWGIDPAPKKFSPKMKNQILLTK